VCLDIGLTLGRVAVIRGLIVIALALGTAACGGDGNIYGPGGCPATGCPTRPTSAPAKDRVRVLADCEHPAARPKEILVACGDGSYLLTKITYAAWNEVSAQGTAMAIANDFIPDRARGKDHAYPVAFTLDQPTRTAEGLLFSRVTVHYAQTNPYGNATDTWPLGP
jgi:hypothetical protein